MRNITLNRSLNVRMTIYEVRSSASVACGAVLQSHAYLDAESERSEPNFKFVTRTSSFVNYNLRDGVSINCNFEQSLEKNAQITGDKRIFSLLSDITVLSRAQLLHAAVAQ